MESFGDKLFKRISNSVEELFGQGETAQLTYQSFNKYTQLIRETKSGKIKVTYPVGYGADNRPISSSTVYTKNNLIERYRFLRDTQLPINGLYQLVTTIEALLCDILRETLVQFPAKIPNKRKLDFEVVLGAKSIEEIKLSLVNSIINEMSYKSPKDFADEFSKLVGVNLLEKPAYHRYIELKATRDIYIHNQGIANEIYIAKADTLARVQLGEELPVNTQYFMHSYECCLQITEILEVALNKIWPSLEFQKQELEQAETQRKKNKPE